VLPPHPDEELDELAVVPEELVPEVPEFIPHTAQAE
jgi:hypothetical protein